MKIRVALHCMASSEIADMIPEETIAEIKKTDSRPMFRAYVVAHEGEARGNLVGYGNIVKKWYRAIVDKLHEKIEAGLQLFLGHGATNDQAGRLPIGRVVGKTRKIINGLWSSIVACYIEPTHRKLNLDVASIEASMDLDVDSKGNLIATDIQDVSAIALGNSEIETPGFAGATLLGQLQAFARQRETRNYALSLRKLRKIDRPE
ncbi:MAG: hypothetical protein MUQ00_06505 [Candidatus Aminicenantes bacterium]|nr:hypothetical protein [Candidatus Aminicenantes bacterium]